MTIKEIEYRAGLPRASVRYYESEGLIRPTRAANGYRDYSEDDLNTLLKVKLLRELGCSLEEILALQRGTTRLDEVLQKRLEALEGDAAELERAKALCRRLQSEGVTYEGLEPGRYLAQEPPIQPWPLSAEPPRRYPWRRAIARGLDMTLCTTAVRLFLAFAMDISTRHSGGSDAIVVTIFSLLLMVAVEPVLLHFFRTTPGKWLCGLRLSRDDGTPLSYGEALWRTVVVLVCGCGLELPVASVITEALGYWRATHDQKQPWERDEELLEDVTPPHKDFPWARVILVGIGVNILTACAVLGGEYWVARLPYPQPETLEQFVENYNKVMNYATDDDFTAILLRDGTQFRTGARPNPYGDYPDFTYEAADGRLNGVALDIDVFSEYSVYYPGTPLACAVNALEGTNAILVPGTEVYRRCKAAEKGEMEQLEALPDGRWRVALDHGVEDGFFYTSTGLFAPDNGKTQHVTVTFRAGRIEK